MNKNKKIAAELSACAVDEAWYHETRVREGREQGTLDGKKVVHDFVVALDKRMDSEYSDNDAERNWYHNDPQYRYARITNYFHKYLAMEGAFDERVHAKACPVLSIIQFDGIGINVVHNLMKPTATEAMAYLALALWRIAKCGYIGKHSRIKYYLFSWKYRQRRQKSK